MAKATKLIRVSEGTYNLLRGVCERMARAAEEGKSTLALYDPEPINPRSCGVSMEQAIMALLQREETWRARKRKSAKGSAQGEPRVEREGALGAIPFDSLPADED